MLHHLVQQNNERRKKTDGLWKMTDKGLVWLSGSLTEILSLVDHSGREGQGARFDWGYGKTHLRSLTASGNWKISGGFPQPFDYCGKVDEIHVPIKYLSCRMDCFRNHPDPEFRRPDRPDHPLTGP